MARKAGRPTAGALRRARLVPLLLPLAAVGLVAALFVHRHRSPRLLAVGRSIAPPDSDRLVAALRALAAAGEPHVLERVPDAPAWSPELLLHLNFTRVYVGESARFGPYFDPSRPFASMARPAHGFVEAEAPVSGMAFFAAGTPPPHRYYSGELERDLPHALVSQVRGLERALVSLRPSHASVVLWLGRRGASAPCHYDGYHNAYVQLYGTKRLTLLPPTASGLLHPFPYLHPSHAQCQQRLSELTDAQLRAAGGMRLEVSPGDLLYLPPMWFHETEVLSDSSIAVNGWTGADEAEAADRIFEMPRDALEVEAPGAAAGLVGLLSAAADGSGDDETWLARRVWSERYARLVESGELPALPWSPGQRQPAAAVTSAGLSAEDGAGPPPRCADLAARSAIRAEAVTWAEAVGSLAAEELPSASRRTWVGNLAELVAAEAVGVERTPAFWRALGDCGLPSS